MLCICIRQTFEIFIVIKENKFTKRINNLSFNVDEKTENFIHFDNTIKLRH